MDIPIPCPECSRDAKLSGSGKTRTGRCPAGHRFEVTDAKGELRKAEKSLKDFEQTLNDIDIDIRM